VSDNTDAGRWRFSRELIEIYPDQKLEKLGTKQEIEVRLGRSAFAPAGTFRARASHVTAVAAAWYLRWLTLISVQMVPINIVSRVRGG